MKMGGKVVCGVAVLAVAACSTNQGKLSVRAIPTKLAEGARPVPFRIAEARGQLALGNAALALESFRKALRDDPASVDALTGIATCYDLMGRFDLSRRHYEAALAIAPADTQLLAALAGSLDLQGRGAEAASIRVEITERLAAAAAIDEEAAPVQVVEAPTVPAAIVQQELVELQHTSEIAPEPAVQPVVAVPDAPVQQVENAATPPLARNAVARIRTDSPAPLTIAAQPLESIEAPAGPLVLDMPVVLAEAPAVESGPSVTIKLPPPRPAATAVAEAKPTQAPATPESDPAPEAQVAAAPAAIASRSIQSLAYRNRKAAQAGPRLERLSMGEVALVTVSGPLWRSEHVSSSARSATVRFVPVRHATDYAEVRLLNAARVHRLAARTRAYLRGHGWRAVAIGDAPSTRARSIIFYPVGQRAMARKLSAQFGFAMASRPDLEQVTVHLGRDSVRIAGARTKA